MAQHVTPAPTLEKIRVLAADSTRMSSQLLADALAQDRQFEVTGIEPKGSSILQAVAQKKPHVVLVSSTLEESTTLGFDLTRQVCALIPRLGSYLSWTRPTALRWSKPSVAGHKGFFPAPNPPKRLRSASSTSIKARCGPAARSCAICSKRFVKRNQFRCWILAGKRFSPNASRM